jgi:hypothetical protein
MLRVFNDTARYIDQGGGKRNGSFAIYLEPWHADIYDFLELKKNHGNELDRARDLFYGLWIPDLFMKKVEENAGALQENDEFYSRWSIYEGEIMSDVQNVKITSIDIPFGDIFWLTFKALFASILVGIVLLVVPLFIFLANS